MSAINGREYFARIVGTTQCNHVWMTDGLNPTRCATCGVLSPPPCITTLVAALPNVHRTYTQAELDAAIATERARVVDAMTVTVEDVQMAAHTVGIEKPLNPALQQRIIDARQRERLNDITAARRGTTTTEAP